ncbi:MAG TPA: hypothetical protein VJQ06_02905 [Rhizomicrobium sp.]|nr:hypothetical protein [Rhizomicrobium sp.]
MKPKTDVQNFVTDWVAQNVHSVKGLSNVAGEVNRLAASMTGDAREHGISGGDLHGIMGDIDDYLTEQYEQACVAAA